MSLAFHIPSFAFAEEKCKNVNSSTTAETTTAATTTAATIVMTTTKMQSIWSKGSPKSTSENKNQKFQI